MTNMPKKNARLKFETERLKSGPLDYEISCEPDVLDLTEDEQFSFVDPVVLNVKLTLISETVLMRGRLSTVGEATCSRCLDPVRIPFNVDVNLVYMQDDRLKHPDKHPELAEENSYYYDGEIVYPAEQLRELLMLELPQFPVCEDEPGRTCRNAALKVQPMQFGETHSEQDQESDDSFAAQLKKLRKDLKK